MIRTVLLLSLLTIASGGVLAQTKPKPGAKPAKPAAKPPVQPAPPRPVQGTAQLPGDNGKIGTTYTLGTIGADAVNFTITKAEYVLGPVTVGESVFHAKADEKLLVLHYTLHNPTRNDLHAGWETVSMVAVDSKDTNHNWAQVASRAGTMERLDFDLKPAQKVEAVTLVVVPAKGVVPKLICQRGQATPVLRYDLRSVVAALPEPWRDPADASGATVRSLIPGAVGTAYATGLWSTVVTKIERSQTPPPNVELQEGESIQWVYVTVTNASSQEQTFNWTTLQPKWEDNDGVAIDYNQAVLRGSRDETADVTIAPGKSLNVRYYTNVPKGASVTKMTIMEPEVARAVEFKIP